jgi:peptidoglycan/xylan/chitin deacetylase (PgdA/CDA1 family)
MMRRTVLMFATLCSLLCSTEQAGAQVVKSGPRTCSGVALTFDLCPVRHGAGYDAALVEYLKAHHIPATFFISGRWADRHDREMKDLRAVPFFELGTHGDVHAHLAMLDEHEQHREISGATAVLKDRYGLAAPLFRPPYGEFNDMTVQVVKSLGLQFILWDVVSGDPDPALSASSILARLSKQLRPGSIVVFHANGKGKHTREVIRALDESILGQQRLHPMTVTSLLNCREGTR